MHKITLQKNFFSVSKMNKTKIDYHSLLNFLYNGNGSLGNKKVAKNSYEEERNFTKTQKFNKPFQTMRTILLVEFANMNKIFKMLLYFQKKKMI